MNVGETREGEGLGPVASAHGRYWDVEMLGGDGWTVEPCLVGSWVGESEG